MLQPFLFYLTIKPDRLTDDRHPVHVFPDVNQRRVGGIFSLQGDRFFGEIHTLEKLFRSVNQDSGDLSVFNRRLLLNIDDIAVMDSGTDHAVALTFEGEIAADIVGYIVIAVEVLRGVYRLTAEDTTETRTLDGVGKRTEARGDRRGRDRNIKSH